ncbi:hypothetical protein BDN67DRAFT_1013028 [Paxillus ammoniavirescens]|nr:hypothetical protein BDN67DRAFT_1013028 [Paxillus ammoniavirescens]
MSSLTGGELEEGLKVLGEKHDADEDEATEGEGESGDKVTVSQALLRRPHTQKTGSRNAVKAACGKFHQEVDGIDGEDQQVSIDGQKWKEPAPRFSQRSTSTSRHARSISSSGSLVKGPCGTPVTASSTPRRTTPSNLTTTKSQECNMYIHSDDQVECNTLPNTSAKGVASLQRTDIMDITEIVSGSEEDDSETPPSPIPRSLKKVATNAKYKEEKQNRKQGLHRNQDIWDMVYGGNIEHTVTIGGPVFQIAKQSLNNWRGGFASAAVAVISTLFANNANFRDAAQCIEFAKVMLKKNCFLFSQNKGTDPKAWSGLWRSSFVLQMFAHHFNYIQGRVDVPNLDIELGDPCTALALSCAVKLSVEYSVYS